MGILKNLLVTGSARFVNIIKGTVQKSQNGAFYGTCTTAAATAEKVVTLTDGTDFELVPGVVIGVKFSYTNSADNAKLNVNSAGAKSIWYNTAVYTGHSGDITGTANRIIYYMYDGTNWVFINNSVNCANNSNTIPSAQCETAAATAAKAASITNYTLTANTYLHFNIRYANTAASALTMNINSKGTKPIYINGTASSSSNHTLPAGSYIAFYNGTNWYFRTDGKIPADISGTADNVSGTVAIENGGTGSTTATSARSALGLGSVATRDVVSEVSATGSVPTAEAVVNYVETSIEKVVRAGEIDGGDSEAFTYNTVAIVFIVRGSTSTYCTYIADAYNTINLLSGTAPSNMSVAVSNKTVTVTNSRTSIVNYLVITV